MIYRNSRLFALTAITLLCSSCFRTEPIAAAFEKWQGCWQQSNGDEHLVEVWTLDDTSLMSGYSYTIKGPDTTYNEHLSITVSDSGIYYVAIVAGQNNGEPVYFQMQKPSEGVFVFENLLHDFPQQLKYTFINDNELDVTVSGSGKSFDIHYQKCQ